METLKSRDGGREAGDMGENKKRSANNFPKRYSSNQSIFDQILT